MCVFAFAWEAHPRWRLVLAGNRDEFHARPSAPLARWEDEAHLIAGRDLQSGGSWLGVSEHGRLAVVTNVRSLADPDPSRVTRGRLITEYLINQGQYAAPDLSALGDFNPFNLLVATPASAWMISNRPAATRTALTTGVHGLSNLVIGEAWPRKNALELALNVWLEGAADDPGELFEALANEAPLDPPDSEPIFIRRDIYGTRCSTVVAVDAEGEGLISERRFASNGSFSGETTLRFGWHG